MKILLTLLLISTTLFVKAQAQYEVSTDAGHPGVKILTGSIDKMLLQTDTSFKWYKPSQQAYQPDTATISALAKVKSQKMQLVIFGGTWCEDTQSILPKFFKAQELSGMPDANITLFGVNRKKTTIGHIAEALGITNVPTIIVLKDGKELGRVVEYGKTGKWDKELADIINKN